jgi:MarR family transcriptional regulator, organic hydroperoxide resistance regulator
VAVQAKPRLSPAHEAQKFFFELGMEQRTKVGAELHGLGLSFAQAHALRLLDPDEPMPMSALAERLFCDASNVTGIVDRLEGRGLIERRPAEHDRRVKLLVLTAEGDRVRRIAESQITQPPPEIAALPLEHKRALRDALRAALVPMVEA